MSPLRHSTCSGCTYESILAVWAVAPRLRLPSGQQSKFNLNLLLAWSCIGSSSSSLLANWSSVELNHFEFQRAVTSFEAEVSKKLRLWIWNPAAARALAAMCTHCETAAHASHVISDGLQLEAGLLVVVQQVLLYSFWRCSHRPRPADNHRNLAKRSTMQQLDVRMEVLFHYATAMMSSMN